MSGGPQVFLGATTFCFVRRQTSSRCGVFVAWLLVAPRVFRAPEAPAAREAPAGTGLLLAPRVFRAPEGPAAREARRPHFVLRRASKPARALRSLRRPPHQWGMVADSARLLVAWPGPAAAHGQRSLAPPVPVWGGTGGTFARVYLRRIETLVSFAGR